MKTNWNKITEKEIPELTPIWIADEKIMYMAEKRGQNIYNFLGVGILNKNFTHWTQVEFPDFPSE